jgi:predicted outer membrane repeat protein
MRYYLFLLLVLLLTVQISNLQAFTIHVPGDEPTIQAGIDAAVDGDTVLVADGIFTGEGNRDIDYNGKAIVVMSENGYEATVIDCESIGRGFYFHSLEDESSVLKGFTIKNGNAWEGGGGGIYCYYSSPYILQCYFQDNSASTGGGIGCNYDAMPIIEECTFTGNYGDPYGGGIHTNHGSDAIITKCEFYENEARTTGGGIRCADSSPTISNSIFINNSAVTVAGGAIHCLSNSHPTFINCTIGNNDADQYGGGMIIGTTSNPIFLGCLIYGNIAPYGAGILARHSSVPTFTNCTIADNQATAGHGGGITIDTGTSVTITNSIFWDNDPDEIDIINGSISITYSDIEGGWPGEGNIDEDPLFIGGDWDLHALMLAIPQSSTLVARQGLVKSGVTWGHMVVKRTAAGSLQQPLPTSQRTPQVVKDR